MIVEGLVYSLLVCQFGWHFLIIFLLFTDRDHYYDNIRSKELFNLLQTASGTFPPFDTCACASTEVLYACLRLQILAMVIGCVPVLKRAIFTTDAPLYFFTDSCTILGYSPFSILYLLSLLIDLFLLSFIWFGYYSYMQLLEVERWVSLCVLELSDSHTL